MTLEYKVSAEQALQKLREGNEKYLSAKTGCGDIYSKSPPVAVTGGLIRRMTIRTMPVHRQRSVCLQGQRS